MIERVNDELLASECDILLTKLIQDEKQYDDSIEDKVIVKDYFKNVIKDKENILLSYKEKNNVCGYIYLKHIVNNNKNGYLIDGLYVDIAYRKNGIATKLLDEALRIVKKSNAQFIDINVLFDNKIAYKIYKSF